MDTLQTGYDVERRSQSKRFLFHPVVLNDILKWHQTLAFLSNHIFPIVMKKIMLIMIPIIVLKDNIKAKLFVTGILTILRPKRFNEIACQLFVQSNLNRFQIYRRRRGNKGADFHASNNETIMVPLFISVGGINNTSSKINITRFTTIFNETSSIPKVITKHYKVQIGWLTYKVSTFLYSWVHYLNSGRGIIATRHIYYIYK